MSDSELLDTLVQRLREGDPAAAGQLFARYAQQLTRLAEHHLSRKLAGRIDGDDVVQSVFRTFFRRRAEGKLHIDSTDKLWHLLVKLTVFKARTEARFHTTAGRDVHREATAGETGWLIDALARDPEPAEAATLVDLVESLCRGRPPYYARILELRLAGQSLREIAHELGITRRLVERAILEFRERLKSEMEDPPP